MIQMDLNMIVTFMDKALTVKVLEIFMKTMERQRMKLVAFVGVV